MAILYEIEQSGFADMLRSGIVVTGGAAQCANICNFINDISGYKVRTGYPKHLFSHQGCEGLTDTTAATSIGLLLAAKNSANVNCIIVNDEEVTTEPTVIIEKPEDDVPRDIFGDPIEEKPVVKPVKPTASEKSKQEESKKTRKPIWKAPKIFSGAKEMMDDLFKSMNDDNV